MKVFRNKDAKISLIAALLVGAVMTAIAFIFVSDMSGVIVLITSVVMIALHIIVTHIRYNKISELSDSIDRILHGEEIMRLADFEEGELSLLSSEIYKMTVRLHEQAEILRGDKILLSDAIADISHQIRTPLTSMNILAERLSDEKTTHEDLLIITRELKMLLQRLDWLISALLKLSRIDSGSAAFKKETVPVRVLISRALEPLQIPLELKNITLTIEGDSIDEQAIITLDIAWNVEALGNIIKNCLEHTPCGGDISIRYSDNGICTEIIVTDSGNGIPDEDLPHIFERFYRGRASGENGVGIGLALARSIITSENGTVRAENRRDGTQGAIFTVKYYKITV